MISTSSSLMAMRRSASWRNTPYSVDKHWARFSSAFLPWNKNVRIESSSHLINDNKSCCNTHGFSFFVSSSDLFTLVFKTADFELVFVKTTSQFTDWVLWFTEVILKLNLNFSNGISMVQDIPKSLTSTHLPISCCHVRIDLFVREFCPTQRRDVGIQHACS